MIRKSHLHPSARLAALLLAALLVPLAGQLPLARAATRTVDIRNPACNDTTGAPYCHIQKAIDAPGANDTIFIAAGTYIETLTINENTTLAGAGAGQTIIDGNQAASVVTIPKGSGSTANTVTISGVTIRNGNASASGGGGIQNRGTLTLTYSAISANKTTGTAGGGLYNNGATAIATLIGSTLSSNIANKDGGAIYNNQGTLNLANTTIAGNSTATGNQGGAIYNNGGTINLNNATLSANTAVGASGGGIYNSSGTINLRNTILSGNTGGGAPECYGTIASQGNNLIKSAAGCTIASAGNIVGQDAQLGPLQNNGGRTQTLAPQPGSPAIDHGAACEPGDQRRAARPIGSSCDIGAYETGLTTWYVNPTSGSDDNLCSSANPAAPPPPCRTIAEVIVRAVSNETILLDAGRYAENLTIDKNLSLLGPAGAVIDGGAAGPLLSIALGTTVNASGLTLDNSQNADRRAIDNQGTLRLTSLAVTRNRTTGNGGGILNSGTLTIDGGTFTNNIAAGNGGAIANSGSLSISGATFGSNSAGNGGAIFSSAGLTISGSTLVNNAAGSGGAIFSSAGLALTDNSSVAGNHANGGDGGGIVTAGGTLSSSTLSGNTASANGGGLANTAGTLTLSDMTVNGSNKANGGNGGGIFNSGAGLSISGSSSVSNNQSSQSGGGIFSSAGVVALANSTLSGNTANANGGGVGISGGSLSLANMTIEGNTATSNGAGLAIAGGSAALTSSTISANQTSAGSGGGAWNAGALTVSSSTFSSNRAASGGAIANDGAGGSLTLVNSTLSANSGGGIANSNSGTIALNNTTISANSGGGIVNSGGAISLSSSIVALNPNAGTPDCTGALTSLGYSLIQNSSGCGYTAGPGDITGAAANLNALADNGGPTQTMQPKNNSPAIDHGSPEAPGSSATSCAATDQRGTPRPVGARCDMGAYERGAVDITTWYVAPAPLGSNSNSCKSADHPCASFAQIINTFGALDGDTIMIADGTYNESLSLSVNLALIGAGAQPTIHGTLTVSAGFKASVTNLIIRSTSGDAIANSGTLTVTGSLISASGGRGIFNSGTLTLTSSDVSDSSGAGGGIVNTGMASLISSSIKNNSGTAGGIDNSGTLTINGSSISNNTASGSGGGINNTGAATLTNSTISGNKASGAGGGVANSSGATLAIATTSIAGNSTSAGGGGVANSGSATMTDSSVAGNTATAGAGGIQANGASNLTINTSTISGNSGGQGGGIGAAGTLTIRTSTIANNTASAAGGALQIGSGSTTIVNTTISANSASGGASGIANSGGTVTLANSILAGDSGPECSGAFTSLGHNLIGAGCIAVGVTGDQIGADPQLGPLQSNGGPLVGSGDPLLTMAPNSSSPALNAGDNAACGPFDQRGVGRPQGGTCDIGAVELEPLTPLPEAEPNDTLENADALNINGSGLIARVGTISSAADVDLFRLTARPGATVEISLGSLPADYDMMLVADPSATDIYSDSGDLRNITDFTASHIFTPSHIFTVSHIFGPAFADHLIAVSDERDRHDESIQAFLRQGGQYYLLIYGYQNVFDSAHQYRLDVTLHDGTLIKPAITADAVAGLSASSNNYVNTIYLYNSQRMSAAYASDPALGNLLNALKPGSQLLGLQESPGVAIDLSGAMLLPADAANLTQLYAQSDASPRQPLLANEVARKIWLIIQRALDSYYPNAANLVIVGGDNIIPFYRVPDEMGFGNESEYGAELQRRGAGAYQQITPQAGALFYNFTQTDNFYADRAGTPWRGRALYLPDMGIGRLVERPSDIWHYLNGYLISKSFTINAGRAGSSALVTGYSYLTDNANQIADRLGGYLRDANGAIVPSRSVQRLIGDNWDANTLTNIWVPGLANGYSGAHSPYDITAINGHFSHDAAIPATNSSGAFQANQIYDPNVAGGSDQLAYFKIAGAPTLLFSVGCHSGLSVWDGTFSASAPQLQADFPSAVLKQGGNWIGNTGYGYGDTGIVGYSERLAALYTKAIGRRVVKENTDIYLGATIGESLARAKRQYLQTSGSGSFSVADEKVLEEWTLYGLPFIRVSVPNPTRPEYGKSFDPVPQSVPPQISASLPQNGGVFTRVITLTNTFDSHLAPNEPPQVTSTVEDSFLPGQALPQLSGAPQTALGKPVLPLLTYDITLNDTGLSSSAAGDIPIPRGVQLRSAISLPSASFNPRITTLVTDVLIKQNAPETALEANDQWLPVLPYTFQRTSQELPGGQGIALTDKLLVIPAQFIGTQGSNSSGQLRRFTKMVFEITYIDPRSAPARLLADTSPPIISAVEFGQSGAAGSISIARDVQVSISANASDSDSGIRRVSATYTVDGLHWQRQELAPDASGTYGYSAKVLGSSRANDGGVFFEVLDTAGNVSIAARKAVLLPDYILFLPPIKKL